MTFSTTNLGFFHVPFGFAAVGIYLNLLREKWERAPQLGNKPHVFTGVGPGYGWNRAGNTQLLFPFQGWIGSIQQPAFFPVPPSMIISEKIAAFNACWCFHTRVIYSPVRVSILIVSPSSTKLGTSTSKPVEVVTDLVTVVAVFPFTDGSALTIC